MINLDIYNKSLSNTFNSKTSSSAQKLKPKVVAYWLESKNNIFDLVSNPPTVDVNNQHSSSTQGDLGYFFKVEEAMNGLDRQSFTWGVCDAKDVNGNVIRADGNWYAMPNDLSDNLEFGWWSGSISTQTVESVYGGYQFANNPTATFPFQARPCNSIKVLTSEYYGQVHTYRLTVRSDEAGVPNPVYTEVISFQDGQYFYEHYLPPSLGHNTISQVEIEIISTKNPEDHGRIQEINVIYKTDISDDILTLDTEKTRDLHTTELPIAGDGSSSVNMTIDNTDKSYNIFNTSSTYGKYMKKNVKFESTIGWQILKSNNLYINAILTSALSSSDTTLVLNDVTNLPDGGAGNYYVIVIDPDNYTREYVLVSSKSNDGNLTIAQRGFFGSKARSHNVGTVVRFETFEYPAYVESWVDEWQSGSESMTVVANTTDWTKFASEKIINNGFFIDKATTSDAVEGLLLTTGFPRKNFKGLNRYKKTAAKSGAVLHLNFSESALSGSGSDVVDYGLRARFFAMPTGQERLVKDIRADALDRELSPLEKAMGETPNVAADYVVNTQDINTNTLYALDLIDFSFTKTDGTVVDTYYNMVFDGVYIAPDTGNQVLGVSIAHGGVRLYLEDVLILDEYYSHQVGEGVDTEIESEVVNLEAGKPYRLRIEAFQANNTNIYDTFGIKLLYAVDTDPLAQVPLEWVYRVSAFDIAGSSDASYTVGDLDCGKVANNAIYSDGVQIGLEGGLVSDPDNYCANISNVNYARLPYDQSWDLTDSSSENYTGRFSLELNIKSTQSGGFGNDGEYISCIDTNGFEFFNDSTSNGFKIKTSSGIESVSSSGVLSTSDWTHINVTFDGEILKYYINGDLEDSLTLSGSISSWSGLDITFGGRGSSYVVGTGLTGPTSGSCDFYCDQFIIYNECLSSEQVADRYTEAVMQPITTYPFLYGNEASVRDIISEITLADLGRFYVDELGYGRYEHFYRYFEPSIEQHSVVQSIIDDENHIISADYNVQLQTNKVIVKIAGLSTNLSGTQSLWRADNPTILAVVNLESAITANSNSMTVSTTVDPPFYNAGYLVIDDEIIKYSSKTPTTFNSLERGMFGTTPVSHSQNSKVREARYWDLRYNKAPAYNVKDPLISGIEFEDPDQIDILVWKAGFYGAELVICVDEEIEVGSVVLVEGTDPISGKVSFAAVAGIPVLLTEQESQIEEQVAELSESIRLYGLKEVVIENKFITDFDHGQKIADFIISKMSEPVPVINLNTILMPKVAIGDRIKISSMDAFDIINGEYWVVSKSVSYSDSPSQSLTIRKVV
ncbi:MAG: LamG-like jellyroll fold domain-containing protein [Gammaproteobacteria bacterium]